MDRISILPPEIRKLFYDSLVLSDYLQLRATSKLFLRELPSKNLVKFLSKHFLNNVLARWIVDMKHVKFLLNIGVRLSREHFIGRYLLSSKVITDCGWDLYVEIIKAHRNILNDKDFRTICQMPEFYEILSLRGVVKINIYPDELIQWFIKELPQYTKISHEQAEKDCTKDNYTRVRSTYNYLYELFLIRRTHSHAVGTMIINNYPLLLACSINNPAIINSLLSISDHVILKEEWYPHIYIVGLYGYTAILEILLDDPKIKISPIIIKLLIEKLNGIETNVDDRRTCIEMIICKMYQDDPITKEEYNNMLLHKIQQINQNPQY